MSELSFAKQFLTTLNSYPVRIPSDHVEDPKKYPARPASILPKMPRPMSKRQKLAPGQESSINIHLKSIRNPPTIDISLSGQPASTSILYVKQVIAESYRLPLDTIRLLYKKKPCSDVKAVKDFVPDGQKEVEFGVMIIGGGGPTAGTEGGTGVGDGTKEEGKSDKELLLSTEEFWEDLRKFLEQRLNDRSGSEDVWNLFRNAWKGQNR